MLLKVNIDHKNAIFMREIITRLAELHHIEVLFTLEQTIDFDVCHLVQEVPLISLSH